jgi:two-component system OmpR family sensor kinase
MLAQAIATIGVGGAIWLKQAGNRNQAEQIDLGPPTAFLIESAASTLQYGGVPALRKLLGNVDDHHQIVAVDDHNQELLGRTVSPEMLSEARAMLKSNEHRREVQQASAQNGDRYLLFAPRLPPDGPMPPDDHRPPFGNHAGEPPHPPGDHPRPFLVFGTAVLASLIFALILAWYFSKPIHSLRSAFEAVAHGDLDTRLGSEMGLRRDELADLGRDFDSMVERLHKLVGGQRRLLHDVSHELRSPLARLQVAIGLARQQPDRIEASLARIERESARMEKLVDELLTLSKLEAAVLRPSDDDIDLGELVADVVDDAKFEAEANDRKLECVGTCAAFIKGDPELLHRAIENVVRNALKHTAVGTTIVIESQLDAKANEIRLTVLDRGPGVPQDELQRIFEPFFRGTGAVQSSDGHGLGLAIAQRVVRSHGGRIVAANREGGGLSVDITLPVARRR